MLPCPHIANIHLTWVHDAWHTTNVICSSACVGFKCYSSSDKLAVHTFACQDCSPVTFRPDGIVAQYLVNEHAEAVCLQGVKVFSSHTDWITSIAWSKASPHHILTTSHDKTAKLWDTRTAVPLQTLEGHADKVSKQVHASMCYARCIYVIRLSQHTFWLTSW